MYLGDCLRILLRANDVLVEALTKIGLVGGALHEEMRVVWHEAVRENCERLIFRGTRKLIKRRADIIDVVERRLARSRANRQKIAMRTAVGKSFGTRGAGHMIKHGSMLRVQESTQRVQKDPPYAAVVIPNHITNPEPRTPNPCAPV
jgi:hypothetical protein